MSLIKQLNRRRVLLGGGVLDESLMFIFKVTVGAGENIPLPFEVSGSYDLNVDYGEGDGFIPVTAYNDANANNTYASAGTYTIKISGACNLFRVGGDANIDTNIVEIVNWGTVGFVSLNFIGCSNMIITATDILDTSGFTSFQSMFSSCTSLVNVPNINEWDTSNVTTMSYCFYKCYNFSSPVGNWDVSKVVTFSNTFAQAYVFNEDLSNWTINPISNVNMSSMFYYAKVFNSAGLNNWNMTKVTSILSMFGLAYAFNQDLNNWNVLNINIRACLSSAKAFSGDISSWDVSNQTSLSSLLTGTKVNYSLNHWDVSNVTNFGGMFNASIFNQPLNLWDVSAATTMGYMFYNCPFNQDISGWNTSNVTTMAYMFRSNRPFNQNIGGWDTSKVTSMREMFAYNDDFDQDISSWDFSLVTDLRNFMFYRTAAEYSATNYDALLNKWNINAQDNLEVHMGTIQHTAAGLAARTNLINVKGWTITDGGQV